MSSLSGVILDLDGLMLDTERVARRAWRTAAAEFGYTIEDQLYERVIGRTPEGTQEILKAQLGDQFPFRKALHHQQILLNGLIDQEGLERKPGLAQLLRTIEALRLKVAVATSSRRASALRKLSAARMNGAFETLVCGDDVAKGKPAPDIFLAAARELGARPEHCLVLEDSDAGALGAHAAGMRVILVPDLKTPSAETGSIAWRVCPSLGSAAALLRSMGPNGQPRSADSVDAA